MSDLSADPTLLEDSFPKTTLPYTGDLSTVDDLVTRVMGTAHQFGVNAREGMAPEENLAGLRAVVDGVRDTLAGKDAAYETLPWQTTDLPDYLRERFGMGASPDPVGGYLTRLALNVVRTYREWQADEIDDSTAEDHLAAFKMEAVRDLLGMPDERGQDG